MTFVRNTHIETRLLPDGFVVLYSAYTNWAHTLTPMGAIVWELSDGAESEEQLLNELADFSGIPITDEIRNSVHELLNEFLKLKLLTVGSVQEVGV